MSRIVSMGTMKEISVSDLLDGSLRGMGGHIFRGERNNYSCRTPAVYRRFIGKENYDNNIEEEFKRIQHTGMTIYDDLVAPKLKHNLGFSFYNDKVIGEPLIAGYIAPGATRFYLQIVSLLQHYGMQTQFLDVTFDPLVALYFACFSPENGTFHDNGYGYIYLWHTYALNDTENNDFLCIDLTEVASFFIGENISASIRPQVQKAAALCVNSWLSPLWENKVDRYLDLLNRKATGFAIDRSKIDYSIFNGFNPYPDEPLCDLINKYISKC